MSDAAALWERFLDEAEAEIARLHALDAGTTADELRAAAGGLFSVRVAASLVGVEPIARVAAAVETALLAAAAERTWPAAAESVAECARALRRAVDELRRPDASGARLSDPTALDDAAARLEARRPAPEIAAPPPHDAGDDTTWVPQVDEDMIDPFLEEATERTEALSQKLLALESAPRDTELVREIFRDLHTIKGSSGFVGLRRMNQLAHAAEDLVGHLRDGTRAADRGVIDALLGALDGLRAILAAAAQPAASRTAPRRIDVPIERAVALLRSPGGALAAGGAAMAAPAPAPAHDASHAAAKQTLRVDFDKLDALLNLVGELVLTRAGLHTTIASLGALARELDGQLRRARHQRAATEALDDLDRFQRIFAELASDLGGGAGALDHVSAELRQQVMKLRMLPIGRVFTKYHRTVRELAHQLGKQVALVLEGTDTELDKVLLEQLEDPLMHLVRNGVDHGVELPDARRAAGKPPEGTLRLSAHHRGNQIVIELADDGAGIHPDKLRNKAREKNLASEAELAEMDDQQVLDVIFRPGFSTAARVTEVSGRGVGMDVVRDTVNRLSGSIDIASTPGVGSTFTLRLPLTLAIIQVLQVRVAGQDFALPLDVVQRTLAVAPDDVHRVADRELLLLEGTPPIQVPLIWVADALELGGAAALVTTEGELPVILVDAGGETYGLIVDRLQGKREIVLKSLGELIDQVPCAAGATLIGDRVALILDAVQVVQRGLARRGDASRRVRAADALTPASASAAASAPSPAGAAPKPRVLLAEDSDVVRESLKRALEAHGCEVADARDGAEALALAERDDAAFDLVSTDVIMPVLDGYELTRRLRAHPRHKDVPIVMVTSRGEHIDRVRGFDAGVDEYLTKPLDAGELTRAVDRLLERTAARRTRTPS
jgi:chemotaxis protein histidine kinase CheA/ActR/RegA family two-component response regulator